jgi:citrate synthase
MIELFEQNTPDSEALAAARDVADAAFELTGERPNLEFGLVTLAGIMRAPAGTALIIMALGRMVGWVAHALEEYSRDELIRPRARYVGPPPH